MTTISGNNITLMASDIITVQSLLILREITSSSVDTFDSATNFVQQFIGALDPFFNGYSFSFTIYNTNTEHSITINLGSGMEINPTVSHLLIDTIPPDSSRLYTFIQIGAISGESATLAVYPK